MIAKKEQDTDDDIQSQDYSDDDELSDEMDFLTKEKETKFNLKEDY